MVPESLTHPRHLGFLHLWGVSGASGSWASCPAACVPDLSLTYENPSQLCMHSAADPPRDA
jgi:hypothetical protein